MNLSAIRNAITLGQDPFLGWEVGQTDKQGWNSDNTLLRDSIEKLSPKIIVETGVWKGGSAIHMAKICRDLNLDTAVICIDTWLGCDILRTVGDWVPSLKFKNCRPEVYKTFYDNVVSEGLQKYIIPLHTDSRSGLRFLKRLGIKIDLFHHDSSHQAGEVIQDLELGLDILNPGGHIIVDDYIIDSNRYPHPCDFSGVVADCDYFSQKHNFNKEISGPKIRFTR